MSTYTIHVDGKEVKLLTPERQLKEAVALLRAMVDVDSLNTYDTIMEKYGKKHEEVKANAIAFLESFEA